MKASRSPPVHFSPVSAIAPALRIHGAFVSNSLLRLDTNRPVANLTRRRRIPNQYICFFYFLPLHLAAVFSTPQFLSASLYRSLLTHRFAVCMRAALALNSPPALSPPRALLTTGCTTEQCLFFFWFFSCPVTRGSTCGDFLSLFCLSC